MKKAICLLLVAGIAASLVSCGGGSTTSSSTGSTSSTGGSTTSTSSGSTGGDVVVDYSDPANISAEKIQPSFFLTSDGYEGNEIVWNAIEAYTNIDFQVIPVPLASFSEKLATTLSSGDLPDIMGCRSYSTVDQYGPQGAFLCFEPYIEQGLMPNFVSVLESMPPAMHLATSPDGKRYGAPRIYQTPRMDEALLCRADIFEKLGLTREPETFDEFYDELVALKEAYPNSTPYFSRWGTEHMIGNIAWMMHTNYTYYLGAGATEYVWGPDSQNYKDALAFMAKMYANGLLDKDFATLTDEEYDEKLITGTGLVTFDYQAYDTLYAQNKDLMDEGWRFVAMSAPKYDGERCGYPVLEGYYGYTKAIANSTKYKDELIRFIDWTYSEEGAQALMFGIEGTDYTVNSDGSINMIADIKYAGNPEGTVLTHGLNDQNIFSVLPGNAAEFYENVGDFTIEQKAYINEHDLFSDPIFYARFYDDNERKAYNDLKTPLDTFIVEESVKVIQGSASVDDWDKVIETAKTTYRAEEGLAMINKAYKDTFGE